MKKTEFGSSPYLRKQDLLSLSGEALRELLESVLERGIPFRIRARGFSMSPFIKNNDVITISPLVSNALNTGDVVAFVHPETGKVCVHRLVKKKGNHYFIRGDNVPFPDGLIPRDQILGIVSQTVRKGKRVHWGFGPERRVIALASFQKINIFFFKTLRRILNGFKKKRANLAESKVTSIPITRFGLWNKIGNKRKLLSFSLEITARCNNNCRHCYINLPAGDRQAKKAELTIAEIVEIAEEAVSLGAIWCLITGGEPLLREDFFDVYLNLKRKGLLVSVFTNAIPITEKHVYFFKRYPPRNIEVSVYGVTQETYEKITRKRGSFAAFQKGLDLLLKNNIPVRLKTMALKSNLHEIPKIDDFCRKRTKDYYRFDPLLHLRYDGNPKRNKEIKSERLSPEEIVDLEKADLIRFETLKKNCDDLIYSAEDGQHVCHRLILCGAGYSSCVIGFDGKFRLCESLCHPDTIYDLRTGSLSDAFYRFVPLVRNFNSDKKEFLEGCHICPLVDLCMWCPAHAFLENGEMDSHVEYFCQVAKARAEMLRSSESVTPDRK